MDGKPERKNPFSDCRRDAKFSALKGRGVGSCPYKNPPYKTVWVETFATASQLNLMKLRK